MILFSIFLADAILGLLVAYLVYILAWIWCEFGGELGLDDATFGNFLT